MDVQCMPLGCSGLQWMGGPVLACICPCKAWARCLRELDQASSIAESDVHAP